MEVAVDHPANARLLAYLRSCDPENTTVSESPESITQVYFSVGTHPDIVTRLWNQITVELPESCRWVSYHWPVLVHPTTGVVFGFAQGSGTYAMRLPPAERAEAIAGGARRQYSFTTSKTMLDLDDIGDEWVLGFWSPEELRWCVAAYEFAAVDV
jgi:hypothetical protein